MRPLSWLWIAIVLMLAPFVLLLPPGAVVPLPVALAYMVMLGAPGLAIMLPILGIELLAYYVVGRFVTRRISEQCFLWILLAGVIVVLMMTPIYSPGGDMVGHGQAVRQWAKVFTMYANAFSAASSHP